MSFGFIISRHVNSEKTNKYWNQNVKLIRSHYPFKQIIIIDDNSNEEFIKSDFEYQNITIIKVVLAIVQRHVKECLNLMLH